MRISSCLHAVFIFLFSSTSVATVIRVPQDLSTIQGGIDSSSNGDTVLVDTGRYVENINFNGKNVVVGSLFLTTGDTSYVSETIIDGNGVASTVIFESGEDSSAVLCGFHITGGNGGETGEAFRGGGVTVDSSGPLLRNLLISDNTTEIIGGGVMADSANLRITDVTVTQNAAYYDGGGIYCINSTVELDNVVFTDNTADLGGGIYAENSELTLSGVECAGNKATSGGGIYCLSSDPSLKDVKLTENVALRGGGMFLYDSSPIFDATDRSNVFLNRGKIGSDLYAYNPPVTSVVVDTFTVMSPTSYHAFLPHNFTFDILYGKLEQTESDLYVGPDGDDSDTGLSPSSPLKTVTQALSVILADENSPRTVFLGEGTYSPSTTGEGFPLNVPSFVSLSGTSTEDVVLNAEEEGGVIYLGHAEAVRLENLTITGGLTPFGGGIYSGSSSLDLANVMVQGNFAYYQGGGLYCTDSDPVLANVTMSDNEAQFGGGVYCAGGSHPTVVNSILWTNLPEQVNFLAYGDTNGVAVFYSNLEGGAEGIFTNNNGSVDWEIGNIAEDPLFVEPGGDYHLQESSPCVDAGTALLVLEGDTLLQLPETAYEGTSPDMGAFESPYTATVVEGKNVPVHFALHPNHPNPFNVATTLQFSVPWKERVELTVYDLLGREVRTILDRSMEPGRHQLRWHGGAMHSGIYFVTMRAGDFVRTRKVAVIR